jgi:glycosyltransferase involved in cell wall biosynthesis
MNQTITVFIPAFNEMDNLASSVEILLAKMDELGVKTEILIVDDGSRDGSAQRADELACQQDRVRCAHHARNLGIGMSFRSAVALAHGEWMIFIPADLALHPDELGRYFEAAPQADIVVGLRSDRSDYTWLRHLVSWTNIHLIQTLFGMKLRQFQYISMYRLDVLRKIDIEYWRSAFFLPEILIKARDRGFRLVEVEIRYAPRLSGKPTGAKLKLVVLTVIDIFHFWIRWKFSRRNLESDLLFRPRRTRSP